MRTKKPMYGQKVLFCSSCNKQQMFDVRENLKKCTVCLEKTSYKEEYRKRWTKAKSDPNRLPETASLYYKACPDGIQEKFEKIMGRMHKLSRKEYEVIQLLWEGKTTYEVGRILNMRQSNVTTILERARIKLK